MKPWEETWVVGPEGDDYYAPSGKTVRPHDRATSPFTADWIAQGVDDDDAHLIAAAPELYRALEELLALENYLDGPRAQRIIGNARAALSLARGER